MKTRAAFRAILRGNPDGDNEKPVQSFNPTVEASEIWAAAILRSDPRPQATVEIFQQVDIAVGTVRK